ncbi:C-type mannose receptor 2-like [Girardinichthys multiradiatus]|uniref:C-type mannose receptor 2-like n=1 Tax=Girardinichthys multiradiatus TaxID=208333 RepID=UPI001FAC8C18|nr:C-type mannose receptor 2-like [Girardinichthys multiradiatus]
MDETFFVILLVPGFCATTTTTTYYLVNSTRSWYDAHDYCIDYYTTLSQTADALSSTWQKLGYTKAWIGLMSETTPWLDLDGGIASYFNWSSGQPDNILTELCVTMTQTGDWYNRNCDDRRPSVCFNGSHFIIQDEMSWTDALIDCQTQHSILVQIANNTVNKEIRKLLSNSTEAWIGLYRLAVWVWSDTGEQLSNPNWKEGKVSNLTERNLCAALWFDDGTLTQESCNAMNPFLCTYITEDQLISDISGQQSKKTVVKLKLQTTADLEDPRIRADLKQQLRARLANQGVTNIKLAWKKMLENLQHSTPHTSYSIDY